MTSQTNVSTFVEKPSKIKAFCTLFSIVGFTSIGALLIGGTATYDQRIDTAKEKVLTGQKVRDFQEIKNSKKKIKQLEANMYYYCLDTPQDSENCPQNNQEQDQRYNPLGQVKQVSYEPKHKKGSNSTTLKAFSWQSESTPPMPKSGLGQSVSIVKMPKYTKKEFMQFPPPPIVTVKQAKKHVDGINRIIAENTMGMR